MEGGMKKSKRGWKRRGQRRRRGRRKGAVELVVGASPVDLNPIEHGLYRAGKYPDSDVQGKMKNVSYICY